MRVKLIGCFSVKQEIEQLQPKLPTEYEYLDFNLHGFPRKLREELQAAIDASQRYDLIILTYSRCSDMIRGLVSNTVPLVLPGTHDCIALLLGSDQRRQQLAARNPGAYYFSPGWLEYGQNPYAEYQSYVARFGINAADYLIQQLYGHYNEAVYIDTCNPAKAAGYRAQVQKIARFFDWKMSEVKGDLALLQATVNGLAAPGVLHVPAGSPIALPVCPEVPQAWH